MSAVSGDPINASICVSSLFHPGSWGDSGLLIVFLLTSSWFHLPVLPLPSLLLSPSLSILSSPSTSLCQCPFMFELSSPVNTAPTFCLLLLPPVSFSIQVFQ